MVSYREAPVTDAAAHELLTEYFESRRETFPASQGVYTTTFPQPEQFVAPHGVFLVIEDTRDGELVDVGCGGIRRLSDDASTLEVKHLWVRPLARGTGLGRRLLLELEARAADMGATRLVLDTNASQGAASGLYRSSGYEEIAPYNSNPNATHWFGKTLS